MDAADEVLALARVRSWLRSGRAREVRERAGVSQADIARAAGTNGPQVSRWESGFAVPHREMALRLAVLYEGLEEIIAEEVAAAGRREALAAGRLPTTLGPVGLDPQALGAVPSTAPA